MQSRSVMAILLALAAFSRVSGFSTDRFLGAPNLYAKEDALHMWAVADMELRESKSEQLEAGDGVADAKAIKAVAADAEKADEARARKELKGKDLDAALAVAHDEEARKDKDAKQIEDVAAKEKKDAADTEKEAEQVRHDATEIETAAMPVKKADKSEETDTEKKADAKQMQLVADIEEHDAEEERVRSRDDMANGKAIEKAAAITAKGDKARATKELSVKSDRDAAVAVAVDEEKREDLDAKQMEDVAAKEEKDAEATMEDATRMRKDAAKLGAGLAVTFAKLAQKK